MIKNYKLDEIQKSMNIVARKTTIPQDGESFSDIEHAYEIALDTMSKRNTKRGENQRMDAGVLSKMWRNIVRK